MGALILFDWTHAMTFDAVAKWKKDLDSKCFLPDGRRIPVILIANKVDLCRDSALPDDIHVSQFVQDSGFVPKWFKTSALTGEGNQFLNREKNANITFNIFQVLKMP